MRRTILLVDLGLYVEVDTRNDQVGNNVEGANAVQNIRVIERDLLGYLHKTPACKLETARFGLSIGDTYKMMTRLELREWISKLSSCATTDGNDVHLRTDRHCEV